MNYGLYLSATGVMTNSYRQDVIANNLANSETVGFKKDLALFQQRLTEAQERRWPSSRSNPALEMLGGGAFASPTSIDLTQGDLEPTDNPQDLAILGQGFFAVSEQGQTRLTRDGRLMVDRKGYLVLANDQGQRVLDARGRAIQLDSAQPIQIGDDGQISQGGQAVARVGVFAVSRPELLSKHGAGLFAHPEANKFRPAAATLKSGFVERANLDPTTELAQLMDTQRQLEANANMIRCQDQMLAKLVNEVGKIA